MSALRLAQSATGGGPSTEQPLSDIESKFLQLLGEDFGQGLPGVRVEPFPEVSRNKCYSLILFFLYSITFYEFISILFCYRALLLWVMVMLRPQGQLKQGCLRLLDFG